MISFWVLWVDPKSQNKCPYNKERTQRQRRSCKDRSKVWTHCHKPRNTWGHQNYLEARRNQKGLSLRTFEGSLALLILGFKLRASRMKTILFCLFVCFSHQCDDLLWQPKELIRSFLPFSRARTRVRWGKQGTKLRGTPSNMCMYSTPEAPMIIHTSFQRE